ncbi:MAG: class I SAM-dependent methyltransferase [Bdellovibrionales bacterium]|nr:class I SAM-dependent methyltransferase [Bdellovibrionales bacterium]
MPEPIKSPYFFATKPSGVSSHRPDQDKLGFVEWLSQKYQQKFYVVHRLDKETSGQMLFATSSEAAKSLALLFENQLIEKTYYFVSDKKSKELSWKVASTIAKRGTEWISIPGGDEARTEIERAGESDGFFLYRARPLTGKTHQIRLHAKDSQVPILGDKLYGGKAFPRLMLHSQSIQWHQGDERVYKESPLPLLFENLSLLKDPQLCGWIAAVDRRKTLYPELIDTEQCLRLVHKESGDLRVDQFGSTKILGWWKDEPPTESEKTKIEKLAQGMNWGSWSFYWRPKGEKGDELQTILSGGEVPSDWTFCEGAVRYQGRLERGHNCGLFFDQRDRRDWVFQSSNNKKILNLFAFTCGFSLSAAMGGADKVVSVDLSKRYLQWGQKNFALNDLNPEDPRFEFRAMDSLKYLDWARRKGLQFDIVVCDPPSFSRDGKKTFKVDKQFAELIAACTQVLSPEGVLLFSTNFEKWDFLQWKRQLKDGLSQWGFSRIGVSPSQWDFEWQVQEANLKAFFLFNPCAPPHLGVQDA